MNTDNLHKANKLITQLKNLNKIKIQVSQKRAFNKSIVIPFNEGSLHCDIGEIDSELKSKLYHHYELYHKYVMIALKKEEERLAEELNKL